MTHIAKRTLQTSKGLIDVGGEVPSDLPAEERVRIRKAGAVAELSEKDAERLKKSLATVLEAEEKLAAADKEQDKTAAAASLAGVRAAHEKLDLW